MEFEFLTNNYPKKNAMKIFIKALTGKLILFDVKPNET